MGLEQSVKINIEPGLFEWLAWYHNSMPDWMTPAELQAAGFNVDCRYKPYISADELQDTTEESCEEYYTRNFFVTQCILQATEAAGGNLLLVGHAATLDACTRQVCGQSPRTAQEMMAVIRKVPYLSMTGMEEVPSAGDDKQSHESSRRKSQPASAWRVAEPPVKPLTHCNNARFDWKVLIDDSLLAQAQKK